MKQIFHFLLFTLLSFFLVSTSISQDKSYRASEKELKSKSIKKARKEAKQLRKEGYDVAPGALPMDKQVEMSWIRSIEKDSESGYSKYITANGNAVGESITAAKLQANEISFERSRESRPPVPDLKRSERITRSRESSPPEPDASSDEVSRITR